MPKSDVMSWESVASFVATFPDGEGEGATDVSVQIGESEGEGAWFVRTSDDAGGSDDADDTAYTTRDAAAVAAEELAEKMDEGDGAPDAESYLRAADEADADAGADADGEWCVFFETALDDFGPRTRYATRDAAAAAARVANADLRAHNPGGSLLCSFSVRVLDGEWTEVED